MGTSGRAGRLVADRVSEPVRRGVHTDHGNDCLTDGGASMRNTDDEKSCMLLVMRVLSIVPLNFKVRFHVFRLVASHIDARFC